MCPIFMRYVTFVTTMRGTQRGATGRYDSTRRGKNATADLRCALLDTLRAPGKCSLWTVHGVHVD